MNRIIRHFKNRKKLKLAADILHHARHLRNMREDILRPDDLQKLSDAQKALSDAVKNKDYNQIDGAGDALYDITCKLNPPKRLAGFRENFEVIVVALAVAMAIKAYFLQPFKIPTGSMQPTLYGVTVEENGYEPNLLDKMPLKFIKWIITGDSYKSVVIKKDGHLLNRPRTSPTDPVYRHYWIKTGNQKPKKYKVPQRASLTPLDEALARMQMTGKLAFIRKGTVVWEGVVKAGDHVFVDKVSWNFRQPKRGEIIVFETKGIEGIDRGSHYIKRLVGMPGERIAIKDPSIHINGQVLTEPRQITRIQNSDPVRHQPGDEYESYHNAGRMQSTDTEMTIPDNGYYAFGDNTGSSMDSRYWGHVPHENMMGPAVIVYWPFTRRWGYANR